MSESRAAATLTIIPYTDATFAHPRDEPFELAILAPVTNPER